MGKKIIFIIFAFAIGSIVYLFSMNVYLQKQQIELLQTAFEESDYNSYLSYNVPYYSSDKVFYEKTEDYQINVYSFVGEENQTSFLGYIIFINELNLEKFTISSVYDDPLDQTNMTVENPLEEEVYNHREDKAEEEDISLTYGYSNYQGYYFIYIPRVMSDDNSYIPLDDGTYSINLFDYEGNPYANFDINYQINFDYTKSIEELREYFTSNEGFQAGYSNEAKLDFIKGDVNKNMIIYGVVVLLLGLFIFRKSFLKQKKHG